MKLEAAMKMFRKQGKGKSAQEIELILWLSVLLSYHTVTGVGRGTFVVHLYGFGGFLRFFCDFLGFYLSYLTDPDKSAKISKASSKSGQNRVQITKICPDRIGQGACTGVFHESRPGCGNVAVLTSAAA